MKGLSSPSRPKHAWEIHDPSQVETMVDVPTSLLPTRHASFQKNDARTVSD
jgi:hypothetical protein